MRRRPRRQEARMKAIVVDAYGGPEVLTMVERPTPSPGPGQVRVKVEAAGVNFLDVYHRTGRYPGVLPLALGQEGAGVVEEVGQGVSDLRPGARVAWAQGPGSYATHVLIRADHLVSMPERVTF